MAKKSHEEDSVYKALNASELLVQLPVAALDLGSHAYLCGI